MRIAIMIFWLLSAAVLAVAQTSPAVGKAFWRGTVDDRVHLIIRKDQIEIRTVSGRAFPDAVYSFTTPLPERPVNVTVARQKGRSKKITVIQQPAKANDFTAIVEIYDDAGGAREYVLEISWK